MPKTIKTHYFPHDSSASRDQKIMEMRLDYGARGYGFYWEIIEYLFEQGGTAKCDPKLISMAIQEDVRAVKKFLINCIEKYELFESDGTYFWSNRLRSEIDRIADLSAKRSNAVSTRYARNTDKTFSNKEMKNTGNKDTGYNCSTNEAQVNNNCTTIDKIHKKNYREENIQSDPDSQMAKRKSFGDLHNVLLSESELSELVKVQGENKTNDLIKRLSLYKGSSGKRYQSDFAAIRLWALNDAEKINQAKTGKEGVAFVPRVAESVWDEEESTYEHDN
jgi:hypothetical protein